MHEFFSTCPKGLEPLLQQEVVSLGGEFQRETVGGVWFLASLAVSYRVCLWSRIANKVYLPLAVKPVTTAEQLYEVVADIPWEDHINPSGSLWIDFRGTNKYLRDTQFGALKAKDALVDRIRSRFGERPSVAKQNPDLTLSLRLAKGQLTVLLDLCGESLHRRGYRMEQGAAPLKENLAAGILYRCEWPALAKQGAPLLDPMCGSGTLLIEAALMAADIAPGLQRSSFAFERWLNHQNDIWLELREEAFARVDKNKIGEIRGYDIHRGVLDAAEHNIEDAGLAGYVRVSAKPVNEFKKPTHRDIGCGLIVTNPPYGERLGDVQALTTLYSDLGRSLREEFVGWQAGVFTGNPDLGKFMGLRSHKKYKLFNGSLPAELLLFNVQPEQFVNAPPPEAILTRPSDPYKVTEGARMVMNRLQKNLKQLSKWVKANNIECYRLYDADMPEYSAAVDLYGEYIHIQEYQAPKSVDEKRAAERFHDLVAAVKQVLQPDLDKISIKQRRRNKGKQQYERAEQASHRTLVMREGDAQLEVNLWDYLDTGLFLDHRPVRKLIAEQALNKKFLNLFCYTATASVQAALGGARETVSVDMSHTYLEWAKRNFAKNNLRSNKHRFEQADCIEWLQRCREGFDLILLDPPTFSNSKRMQGVLDIQRDHPALIKRCMELLTADGLLIFSNNLRSFKLDNTLAEAYKVVDYHEQSIDPDFKRNQKIHQCWLLQHKR
ncbi:bifunctional 23S rRNA (guanine(2069)-N(7))-methyltransferase RlmK/23S rRNA (guanine(2445)-N(2))-methyltransferase RlmL [Halioxenophilus sp. WMMB6]|uniref:bifunctional 23S rRNA (guanine(2069)-N(7))-methyltransferase RlmK/23S rRNA (guanine(2445)-N(2))-methyltransferase RlmL n=1 Tax=Halioxenophilus sp. WMMB6 TaxID=3073815 RepID=UPI00295F1E88|nr:bifunctional 23S rRNA (guanine(2069)-N(7))-methyltransferase RlmK/23S rRNA (guanine(2445)-N(2))-methyltransferase RlmL [Halioxenophilus sp. WMMB6]